MCSSVSLFAQLAVLLYLWNIQKYCYACFVRNSKYVWCSSAMVILCFRSPVTVDVFYDYLYIYELQLPPLISSTAHIIWSCYERLGILSRLPKNWFQFAVLDCINKLRPCNWTMLYLMSTCFISVVSFKHFYVDSSYECSIFSAFSHWPMASLLRIQRSGASHIRLTTSTCVLIMQYNVTTTLIFKNFTSSFFCGKSSPQASMWHPRIRRPFWLTPFHHCGILADIECWEDFLSH